MLYGSIFYNSSNLLKDGGLALLFNHRGMYAAQSHINEWSTDTNAFDFIVARHVCAPNASSLILSSLGQLGVSGELGRPMRSTLARCRELLHEPARPIPFQKKRTPPSLLRVETRNTA